MLGIYKHDRGVELGTTESNTSFSEPLIPGFQVQRLNPRPRCFCILHLQNGYVKTRLIFIKLCLRLCHFLALSCTLGTLSTD